VAHAVPALVAIPAGWFWMGWETGLPAERPRHRVFISAFRIAAAPVTNAEYARFLTATGRAAPPFWTDARFSDPTQPVVGVDWFDAAGYCAWLTTITGRAHRLPTEAEWERAARGGLDDARFPWGDQPPAAMFPDARPPLPGPPRVGRGPVNGFGLTDLSGTVHEWCLDWHADGYDAQAPARDPPGPASGTRRVSRGGAWRHQDPWSPVAHRSSLGPGGRYSDYGFRVAASADADPVSGAAS
jgi:formylglycine-generating enzyme required for sulfatase activity